MISDDDLYRLAIFLGSCAMMMIVLYHFLEVNAKDDTVEGEVPDVKKSVEGSTTAGVTPAPAAAAAAAGGTSAIGGGKDR
jgi:oligosaccharyl transferase complex subunit OST4